MSHVISISEITQSTVLTGAQSGKAAFLAIVQKTNKEPEEPSPLLLEFKGIEVATVSYLREAIFALKNYMRTSGSKFYPVVANISEPIREELAIVADARNDVILAVETDDAGTVIKQSVIGSLDPKQATTFERVRELKITDAGSLMERYGAEEKTTSATAWNNRLASLVLRGLIREYSQGRAKSYRPLFDEVQ